MEGQVIPPEAIEAAAKAMARVDDVRWGPIPQHIKDTHLTSARMALEAAAPYMLAGAWDKGEEAGSDNQCAWDGWRHSKGYPITNPYRPAP